MSGLISGVLGVATFLRGFVSKYPRGIVIGGALWIWMWLLVWTNTDNPDRANYVRMYQGEPANWGTGLLFKYLLQLGGQIGLSYEGFVAVAAGAAFVLMVSTVLRFTSNLSLVAFLYFAYPFVFDAIQIRNLLAFSIVALAFQFLASDKRAGVLWYIMLVVVASTIHLSAMFYLILALARSRSSATLGKIVLAVAGLFGIAVLLDASGIRSMMDVATSALDISRLGQYSATDARWGFIQFTALHFGALFMLAKVRNLANAPSEAGEHNEHADSSKEWSKLSQRFVNIVYGAALIMSAFLPAVAINSNFWRPFRNLWLIYAIVFAIGVVKQKDTRARAGIAFGSLLLLVAEFTTQVMPVLDSVAKPIMFNNLLAMR